MKHSIEIMNKNIEKFLIKANNVHKNKYDYSQIEYKNSLTKIKIICPIHGEFWQTPQGHLRGNGCPKCANIKRGDTFRSTSENFIKKAKEVHQDKYDYSKVKYINAETEVEIICPIHGSFMQTPIAHIYQGSGCPKCSGRNLNTEEIVQKFKEIHQNKYDYSQVEYDKMHSKVKIICPIHGEFYQTPSKHLLGQGCPLCAKEKLKEAITLTTEDFIKQANIVHNNKYNYSLTDYKGSHEEIKIICPIHGEFTQRANDHSNGHGCPTCVNEVSIWENEVKEYIESLDLDVVSSLRNILPSKKEIDIFIPSKNIGIECNGLYWHSEKYKDKKYHLLKTENCNKQGIRLIHIFEDEWINKKEIVKSIINHSLGKYNTKIYARQCTIKEITREEKKNFLNKNHIQGNVGSIVNLGLFYNNELVSVMTFGNVRTNLGRKKEENVWEMLRFCNKLNYVINGGASKLFNYFIKKYNPQKIISYADRRYFNGNLYYMLGFNHIRNSQPNYFYIVNKERKNRFNFRKDVLIKEGYDKNLTEHQIMLKRKIYRIYDCGCNVYEWTK